MVGKNEILKGLNEKPDMCLWQPMLQWKKEMNQY